VIWIFIAKNYNKNYTNKLLNQGYIPSEDDSYSLALLKEYGHLEYTKDELKDILASTLRWLFVLPFMTALVISWIIIGIINQLTLTSYTGLAVICSIIYLFTELIMYMIIKVLKRSL